MKITKHVIKKKNVITHHILVIPTISFAISEILLVIRNSLMLI